MKVQKTIALVLAILTVLSVMSIGASAAPLLCNKDSDHEWILKSTIEPTCEHAGTKTYSCKNCTLGVKQEVYVEALPHKDDNHNGDCDVCKTDTTKYCDCLCHKSQEGRRGILTPLATMVAFFRWLFKINHYCECGYHQINK